MQLQRFLWGKKEQEKTHHRKLQAGKVILSWACQISSGNRRVQNALFGLVRVLQGIFIWFHSPSIHYALLTLPTQQYLEFQEWMLPKTGPHYPITSQLREKQVKSFRLSKKKLYGKYLEPYKYDKPFWGRLNVRLIHVWSCLRVCYWTYKRTHVEVTAPEDEFPKRIPWWIISKYCILPPNFYRDV